MLDPACGSGNFLYVALQKLKDLEKEVAVYADACGLGSFLPGVGPWQLYGIETNSYAFDLAQTTIWIGWLQWVRANGYGVVNDPILRPLTGFKCMDAVLDLSDPANPREPEWPAVDFIVSNPPFLGTKKLRSELGDEYVETLFSVYSDRIPPFSDLCCYWFEKVRTDSASLMFDRQRIAYFQSPRADSASLTFVAAGVSPLGPETSLHLQSKTTPAGNRQRPPHGGSHERRTCRSSSSHYPALAGRPVQVICAAVGRSKVWFHKWWDRYLEAGPEGLYDLTRANHHIAQRLSPELERTILSIRRRLQAHATPATRYSLLGATAILAELKTLGIRPLPCERTIERVLERNGLTAPRSA